MQMRDRGVIVQVGSALSERSIPLQSAYCGAKHAIRGFTDALRSELLHDDSHVRLTIVQLPALNTPQFRWSHNHMPRRPRPIAPIFQPEIAADAIVWASRHPHREVKVGGPTAATMVAQKVVPGLLDRYLASGGYDAQQTERRRRGSSSAATICSPRSRSTSAPTALSTNVRTATASSGGYPSIVG